MDQCDECEAGYYLKEWFGEEINRPYNACWSILKMILRWILGLLLLLSYCFCCYWAWRKGRNITRLETKKADKKTIIDNTKQDGGVNLMTEQDGGGIAPDPNIVVSGNQNPYPNTTIQTGGVSQQPNLNYTPLNNYATPVNTARPVANYNSRPITPVTAQRPYITPSYDEGEITIIRERPKTIIREIEQPYPHKPQQHVYVDPPQRQPQVQIYQNSNQNENNSYTYNPRRLY